MKGRQATRQKTHTHRMNSFQMTFQFMFPLLTRPRLYFCPWGLGERSIFIIKFPHCLCQCKFNCIPTDPPRLQDFNSSFYVEIYLTSSHTAMALAYFEYAITTAGKCLRVTTWSDYYIAIKNQEVISYNCDIICISKLIKDKCIFSLKY